jgi:hypothetical protein
MEISKIVSDESSLEFSGDSRDFTVLPQGSDQSKKSDALRIVNADFICKSVFALLAVQGPLKKLDSISKTLDCSLDRVYQCVETLLDIELIQFTSEGYTVSDDQTKKSVMLNINKLSSKARFSDHKDRLLYFCNEFAKGNFQRATDFNFALTTDQETLDWFIMEEGKLIREFLNKSANVKEVYLVELISSLLGKAITKGNN